MRGYAERLYDARDTATMGAYQAEYLSRVKNMPPIEDLLIDRGRKNKPPQTPNQIAGSFRLWASLSGHKIIRIKKTEPTETEGATTS